MLFLSVTPGMYIFSAVWAIIGNIGFGASFTLLNAFLPVLVRHHPKLLYGEPRAAGTPNSTEGHTLLTNVESDEAIARNAEMLGKGKSKSSAALTLSTHISSYGIAIGYTGAVLLQIFSIFLVLMTGSTTRSLQLVLFIIGAWWFTFTIPAAIWLRPRPGPPLPALYKSGSSSGPANDRSWWGYIKYAWVGLGKTIVRARRLKDVVLFLAAWFLVSDGVATVSGTAVLFAKTNLSMEPAALALISVVSTISGVLGAFGWPRISSFFNRSPSQTILICICVFELIPLYGLLGFIPAVRRAGVIGLTSPWEMYLLGTVYGFVLGGVSGYCRSVFGELSMGAGCDAVRTWLIVAVPPGSEAAFYALYAVTDKGSSIFGPTIVGALTDKYGDIRVAFWFLAVLLAAPLPLIAFVDVARGKREGRLLAAEELRNVVANGGSNGETAGNGAADYDVDHL